MRLVRGLDAAANGSGRATSRLRTLGRRLRRDSKGTSVLEFALSLPILMTLGMYGTEIAYMSMVNMEMSQLANSVADNAARLGQTDNGAVTPTVSEAEIDSVMAGALEQGASMDFAENGRVIVSSLERDASTGRQYIHWQRCRGEFDRASSYGNEGTGLYGATLYGMGNPDSLITATNGSAVMYVEVFYEYNGLFGDMFVGDVLFRQEAAFEIRDDRNLTPGVTGSGGDSSCS